MYKNQKSWIIGGMSIAGATLLMLAGCGGSPDSGGAGQTASGGSGSGPGGSVPPSGAVGSNPAVPPGKMPQGMSGMSGGGPASGGVSMPGGGSGGAQARVSPPAPPAPILNAHKPKSRVDPWMPHDMEIKTTRNTFSRQIIAEYDAAHPLDANPLKLAAIRSIGTPQGGGEADISHPIEKQEVPTMRVSGILTGTGIYALLDGPGVQPGTIVKPGDTVGEYKVASINNSSVTLKRKVGQVTYTQVVPLTDINTAATFSGPSFGGPGRGGMPGSGRMFPGRGGRRGMGGAGMGTVPGAE